MTKQKESKEVKELGKALDAFLQIMPEKVKKPVEIKKEVKGKKKK